MKKKKTELDNKGNNKRNNIVRLLVVADKIYKQDILVIVKSHSHLVTTVYYNKKYIYIKLNKVII